MIGGLIMTHSDDRGLVLPPKIAPTKVIVIPIGKDIDEYIDKVVDILNKNDITNKVDRSDKTPGFKFAEAEVKGYPVRIEVGARDIKNGHITLVRRDTLEKCEFSVSELDNLADKLNDIFETMQNDMYKKAEERRNSMLYSASTMEEFENIAATKSGFIKINWCGRCECEENIKEKTGLKSRCILEHEHANGNCICGEPAKHVIYFGRQY